MQSTSLHTFLERNKIHFWHQILLKISRELQKTIGLTQNSMYFYNLNVCTPLNITAIGFDVAVVVGDTHFDDGLRNSLLLLWWCFDDNLNCEKYRIICYIFCLILTILLFSSVRHSYTQQALQWLCLSKMKLDTSFRSFFGYL